jgi:hypothetical protein
MTPIVVLTCARDDEQPFAYLDATIAQIEHERAAGLAVAPVVVCDNTSSEARPELPAGWELKSFSRPPGTLHGNKWAYWEALRVAAEPGTDAAIVLEDDLDFAPNAARRMVALPVPADLGFIMFFAPAVFQAPRMFPGMYRTPAPVVCCQAIKFTRATLEKLLGWQCSVAFQAFVESDQSLEVARAQCGIKYGAHCPELVQHVGAQSVATPGEGLDWKFRHAQTFAKRLDAMTLFSRDELYR